MEFTYWAWRKLVKGVNCKADLSKVNSRILSSWKRCLSRKQDPETLVSLKIPDSELRKRRKEKEQLVETTKPFMKELYEFVKGSGFVVVLLDQEACILELLGDPDVLEKYTHFRVGEIWDEETKGTNAMGQVKIEKVPLQIYATEHYVRDNHVVTCSAAPIWSENGKLIGILDVSGDYKQAHAHTLGMVVAAVKAIQNELSLKAANMQIINSFHNVSEVLETLSDGIVSFDKEGLITTMNPVATQILNMKRPDYMGKSFKKILNNEQLFRQVLGDGVNVDNQEFFILNNRKQAHFLLSACPIIDHKDDICGGVANIREIQAIHQLVHKVVGARALLNFQDIIGESKSLRDKINMARDVAPSKSSVILQGESGTGKEMFAQSIHNASNFANGPFIAINCAAIPRDLIESELFGYEEGAFTGAKRGGNAGKFELANGGTIFLDEIGDMPLDTQGTLLRAIEEKQIVRVGGYRPIRIDARIIAATNKNLKDEIRRGNFREDLYYRLNVIDITIPPLRDRGQDVLLLSNYFINKFSAILGFTTGELDPKAAQILEGYHWPGNVRELANAMERAVNMAKGAVITTNHLPRQFRKAGQDKNRLKGISTLEENEKIFIAQTLKDVDWNISRAASPLGISRNTLYRKIKRYGIENTG